MLLFGVEILRFEELGCVEVWTRNGLGVLRGGDIRRRAVVIGWVEVVGHGGGVMILVVMILAHPHLCSLFSDFCIWALGF